MSVSDPSPSGPTPSASESGARVAWELLCSIALATLFMRFAFRHWHSAYTTMKLSSILLLAKVSADVVFLLIRRMPKGVSISVYDWCIGFLGTFTIMLFRPTTEGADTWYGQALQLLGISLQLLGILSLNRSFGVVAANRGVKTTGMYRLVRHPLYFSYTISFLGYICNQPSDWNVMIYSATLLFLVMRLIAEEKFLMRDEAYREYSQRVRSRLIPGVF